ncbi:MAG TPA: aldolase/citrate lyase family protein [Steroidobacteraceae bacterium]
MSAWGGDGALSRLRRREPVFGAIQSIPSATLTEVAVSCGYDFIILDCERGVLSESAVTASLETISRTQAFSIVRVPPRDYLAVRRYLDCGADGILMPNVRTSAEAHAFVAAATLNSNRSDSSTRINTAREELPLLLAMIETLEGVSQLNAIASTAGIDGLVIGPHDLAIDLGAPNDFLTPEFQVAFARIERAARKAGLLLGTRTLPDFPFQKLLLGGHTFILLCADVAALREGYRTHLEKVRGQNILKLQDS